VSVVTARLRSVVPPVLFGAGFLALWELVVKAFDLKLYFLAPPSKISRQFFDNWEGIWEAMKLSGTNAFIGLVCGTVLGLAVAFALSRFRLLNELVTPLSIAMNAIPIFVLVSIFNNMFSTTSEVPRRLMVTLIVYFIVLVNAARGLTQVSSTHLELMRSYAAGGSTVLRKLRIPNMTPFLHTALKIAAPAAVTTAFVSEYFGGSQNGLGQAIARNASSSRNDVAWAYVGGACLVGLSFYLAAVLIELFVRPGGVNARRTPGR
jgi:NitT/TauT family transport system permease protein